jgi:hypothetical protein
LAASALILPDGSPLFLLIEPNNPRQSVKVSSAF